MFGAKYLEKNIKAALTQVRSPDEDRDIVASGMVQGLQVLPKGVVVFSLEVDAARGAELEPLRQQAEQAVRAVRGVKKVSAVLTAERLGQNAASQTQASHPLRSVSGSLGAKPARIDPHGMEKNPKLKVAAKHIIAIASGKGGVGKSTVAAHIAYNLANFSQLRIGLLDADIYGPSQPLLMGKAGHKPEFTADKKIIPAHVQAGTYGIKLMSIGFMVDAEKALIWRGPMVQSALYQMFRDVAWADTEENGQDIPLDILIVDMPPGTGDAQLTLAQKVDVSGAVIVSTPQDLALADARKAIEMFEATNVPILGLVENMSTHICSACGHEDHIFGHGGAQAEADKRGIPFLGEVPLSRAIRENADNGGVGSPEFTALAEKLLGQLGLL